MRWRTLRQFTFVQTVVAAAFVLAWTGHVVLCVWTIGLGAMALGVVQETTRQAA